MCHAYTGWAVIFLCKEENFLLLYQGIWRKILLLWRFWQKLLIRQSTSLSHSAIGHPVIYNLWSRATITKALDAETPSLFLLRCKYWRRCREVWCRPPAETRRFSLSQCPTEQRRRSRFTCGHWTQSVTYPKRYLASDLWGLKLIKCFGIMFKTCTFLILILNSCIYLALCNVSIIFMSGNKTSKIGT